jgi:hypothetical protein
MGAVYRAYDEGAERVVALKLLELSAGKLGALFEREYETLAKLAHPRVIEVYDFGLTEAGGRYYTMELLAGADLVAMAPLPWVRACEHLRDVCTSLSLLHAQRLLHRDVNPRNVRLDDSGRAKLLDFGALAPFGVSSELVGTPSCMAPEAQRGAPLDARTDLFSLGAVAYWSLTGRLPYAIRRLSEAEQGWSVPPQPPSHYAPGIPKALDELVLSLLSLDPLGRPASAAEVIDRLSAIALLDDSLLAGIAESHLSSAALAGRELEQTKLEQLLARSLRGRGGLVLFEGGPGSGRSRMLSELQVQARLAGLSVLHIAGQQARELGQLPAALLTALRETAPQETRASLPRYQSLLGPLLPPGQPAEAPAAEPSSEQHERALRVASALVGLVCEVSARRPLLISVDDAQCLHTSDAGLLPLLTYAAQDGRVMLCVTRLADGVAPPAIDQLRFMGTQLNLQALDLAAVERLVHSIFGEVPHRARLAQWLSSTGRGNPGEVLRLLRDLVSRGVVRYAQGAWVLPAELATVLWQEEADEQDAARRSRLGPEARNLVELLAVQRGDLGEAVCVRLLPESAPRQVLEALLQLCHEKLVSTGPAGYRLARDTLRASILDELPTALQKQLHRRLANAARDSSADKLAAMQAGKMRELTTAELLLGINAGLHYLRAGDEQLGTLLLRLGAVELTIRGDSVKAAVPDLELAIESFRELRTPHRLYASVSTALTLAGTYTDFRLSYRYGDEILEFFAEVAGLRIARKLARFLGGPLALFVSLLFGFVSYRLSVKRQAANSFREVLLGLMGLGSAVLGVCTVLQDRERASRVCELLAPLRFFPWNHPVRMVHEFQLAMLDHAYGHYETSRHKAQVALAYVQSPAAAARLPEEARLQLEVGIYLLLGQLDALLTDGSAEQTLQAIDKLHTSTSRQTQAALRVAFHGHRGERAPFVHALDEMDQLAAKAGSIWRNDVQVPRMLWSTYALCEDVMSLKRAVQQLDTLADEVPSIARLRDVVNACYLAERGMAAEALVRHESVFRTLESDLSVRGVQYLGAYARVLRKAGQFERARQVCESVLVRLHGEQRAFTMLVFGVRMELALSLAMTGEHQRAVQMLDELAAEQLRHDNPLLHGLTHGARAEVALLQHDLREAQRQLAAMGQWFRSTDHPALFAQFQRLCDRARMTSTGEVAVLRESALPGPGPLVSAAVPVLPDLTTLLHALMTDSQAAAGQVYALSASAELELRASAGDTAGVTFDVAELGASVAQHSEDAFATELNDAPSEAGDPLALSTLIEDVGGIALPTPWQGKALVWFLLSGERGALGVLLLAEGGLPLRRLGSLLLAQLARSLTAGAPAPRTG